MPDSTPLQFDIPDMDCQGCISSITKAVHKIDPEAQISADLTTKRVVIGGAGDAHAFMTAIEDAGFTVNAAG
jgi:copper chaperone CopZ